MNDQESNLIAQEQQYPVADAPERADLDTILIEYQRRQMMEHLTGPIISLFVHVVAMTVIFFSVGNESEEVRSKEVEVQITELKVKPLNEKVLEKVVQDKVIDDTVPTISKPDVTAEGSGDAEGSGNPTGGSTGDFSDGPPSTDDGGPVDFAVLDVKSNGTPLKLSGLYGGRSNSGRKKMLAAGGGTGATESAVLKALRWLKEHQNEDGSWSKTQPVAMCGLALLTYLSHGETPDSKEFGLTVQKAIQYLSEKMNAVGSSSSDGKVALRAIGGSTYAHGIATYALSEAYGMTKIPAIKIPMETGLTMIVQGQDAKGGWDYSYHGGATSGSEAKAVRWDFSVSGWQMQALKAGYIAGADVPGLHEAIEKALDFTKNVAYDKGMFGYSSPGQGSKALMGAGTLCLQLLGDAKCVQATTGVNYISQNCTVVWESEVAHGGSAYAWYYWTQAMFMAGNKTWKAWNEMFQPVLLKNQKSDGHWEHAGKGEKREYDPYYCTTLCALMLQVYYRYLPTFKISDVGKSATANALDLGDSPAK